MASSRIAHPNENEFLAAHIDGAVRPIGRDERTDAGLHLDDLGLAVTGFEQQDALAALRLVEPGGGGAISLYLDVASCAPL